jgi:phage baseplate assembly protein W
MIWYGYNAPFLGGQEGVMSRQTDDRLIRNDLLQLLLTSPGERVMRPTFGSGIRRFLFQPITTESIDDLKTNINNTIKFWEPRVNVTGVEINVTGVDQNFIEIKVYGFFLLNKFNPNTNNQGNLIVELQLPLNNLDQATVGIQVANS